MTFSSFQGFCFVSLVVWKYQFHFRKKHKVTWGLIRWIVLLMDGICCVFGLKFGYNVNTDIIEQNLRLVLPYFAPFLADYLTQTVRLYCFFLLSIMVRCRVSVRTDRWRLRVFGLLPINPLAVWNGGDSPSWEPKQAARAYGHYAHANSKQKMRRCKRSVLTDTLVCLAWMKYQNLLLRAIPLYRVQHISTKN